MYIHVHRINQRSIRETPKQVSNHDEPLADRISIVLAVMISWAEQMNCRIWHRSSVNLENTPEWQLLDWVVSGEFHSPLMTKAV